MASTTEPILSEYVQLLALLALVAAFYFLIIPAGIPDPDGFRLDEGLPPSFGARLAAGLATLIICLRLIRLTVGQIGSNRLSRTEPVSDVAQNGGSPDPSESVDMNEVAINARVLIGVALALVFSLGLIPLLGFLPASVVLLMALLWLLGERGPVSLLLYPLLVTLGVWLLFSFLLSVRLPEGLLTSWIAGG